MKPILLSPNQFEVLRAIAAEGFEHAAAKRLCSGAGLQLLWDEPQNGFLQYTVRVGPNDDDRRLLSIETPKIGGDPFISLPLFYFPEDESKSPDECDRLSFDEAFQSLSVGFAAMLGQPLREGTYEHSHSAGWPYHYSIWQIPEAQVFLLQDEHDIQFGMDVSLWLFAADSEMTVPLPF